MKIAFWILSIFSLSTLVFFTLIGLEGDTGISEELTAGDIRDQRGEEPEPLPPVRTLHFGDLMLDRGVQNTISRNVNPFEFVSDFINDRKSDIITANLEGPFAAPRECQDKPYSFRFEPAYVSFLQSAGITAVSLSNNHTLDCFSSGLEESKDVLSKAGIDFFGGFLNEVGAILYKDLPGGRVALLGFDDTMKMQSLQSMKQAVGVASQGSDLVVVNIHWGEEYLSEPTARQRELANELVLSGADLIIGHHPHVIEPAEEVLGSLVFYSLGNFVFDQLTLETQTGYAVETNFDLAQGVVGIEIHPYLIIRNQPTLLYGEDRLTVCRTVLESFYGVDGCQLTHELL